MSPRVFRDETTATWYNIEFPVSAYTFPHETLLQDVRFDDTYIHLHMTDGRRLSVPLQWIPTLYHAAPSEREKYEISPNRKMVIWDPDKCAINDELRIDDYLIARTRPGNGRS